MRPDPEPPADARRREPQPEAPPGGERFETLAAIEARHIRKVLAHTGGRIEAAAQILGIHRNTLTRKLRKLGP